MKARLTLKLDSAVKERAKRYAKANQISLSMLIENYLFALTKGNSERVVPSPLVESLTGVVSMADIQKPNDYGDYLIIKYG